MSNKLPEVERTDRICNLLKGEIEEPDAGDYPDEDELIEEQKKHKPKEMEEEEEHPCYVHSLDNHAHSYILTPVDSGIFRGETTYTPMLERKKR